MSKDTYLNSILTVLALLLAGLLWTQVAERTFVDPAHGQIRSGTARTGIVTGDSDAGDGVSSIGQRAIGQRQEIIDELAAMRAMLSGLDAYIRSGKLLETGEPDGSQRVRTGGR